MKYSSKNKPLVCMQTQSTCYKGTRTMSIKGILWHSTGANNPNLKRYVQPSDNAKDKAEMLKLLGTNTSKNDWNHIDREAGLNAWIGKLADGTITTVQTMPWNYRPWGCGSGSKGTCNSGWIQFEICEADLADQTYFNKAYKEACELTAYLCDLYDLDPKGTVTVNGVKVPVILCHQDAYQLKMGSNHSDVYHWFKKHGKDMDDVRNDVAKLMKPAATGSTTTNTVPATTKPETATSLKFKVGDKVVVNGELYANANADKAVSKVTNKITNITRISSGAKHPYNTTGDLGWMDEADIKLYTTASTPTTSTTTSSSSTTKFKVGDEVKLAKGAKYANGNNIPDWLENKKLYVRQIYDNGNIVFSNTKSGGIIGVIKPSGLVAYDDNFKPYKVKITASILNVRAGAGTKYKIVHKAKKNEIYTIIEEKDGWGLITREVGWMNLSYTKKV